MPKDTKHQNTYSLLVRTNKGAAEGLHHDLVKALAGGPNMLDICVSYFPDGTGLKIFSSAAGGQLPRQAIGNVKKILTERFRDKYISIHYEPGKNSLGLKGIKEIRDPHAEKRVGALETQIAKMQRDLEDAEAIVEEYASGAKIPYSPDIIGACLVAVDDQPKRFEDIEEAYSVAREMLGNASDIDLVRCLSQSDLESDQEYQEILLGLEQAQEAIERAKGNRFLDASNAKEYVRKNKGVVDKREQMANRTRHLRGVVAGKSLIYSVYIDRRDNGSVCLMTPFAAKNDSQGILERELREYMGEAVTLVGRRNGMQISSSERRGFLTYLLRQTNSLENGQLERVRDELVDQLFTTQRSYPFGAAGLRIDIETIASTAGRKFSQPGECPKTRVEVKHPISIVDDQTLGTLIDSLRESVLPGLPDDPFSNMRRSMRKKLCAVGLDIYGRSDVPLELVEARRKVPDYILDWDPDKKANEVTFSAAMNRLRNLGFLEKVGKGLRDPWRVPNILREQGSSA